MKRPELLEFLSTYGLSIAEFHLLKTIHYGPHPAERLAPLAAWGSEQSFGRHPSVSESECKEAITSLLSKGLLQVIDGAAIARVEADLATSPVYNLMGPPNLGQIDFTQEGGRLWLNLNTEVFNPVGQSHCCGNGELNEEDGTFRFEYLGETEQSVREASASDLIGNTSEIISVEGPVPIGAWRNYWWDVVYPQGYRMVIITRPAVEAY